MSFDIRSMWDSRYWFVLGAGMAVVAALAATAGVVAAGLVACLIAVALAFAIDRDFPIHVAAFLTFATLPAAVPTTFAAGGVGVVLHELFLVAAFAMAVPRMHWSDIRGLTAIGLFLWAGLGSWWGAAHGYPFGDILYDARSSWVLAVAFVVVSAARPETLRRLWTRTIPVTLVVSAVTMALGSIGLLATNAHTFAARLDYQESGGSASRQLGSTGFIAVAVLMCAVTMFLLRKPVPSALRFMVPLAVAVVALSFSRSHLVGLAVTVLYGLYEARRHRALAAVFPRVALAGLAAIPLLFFVLAIGSTLAPDSWIRSVGTSYALRVFEGLGSQARTQDMSLHYRIEEYEGLLDSISEAPLLGQGFGHAYREPEGAPGQYFHDAAPFYSHNFYLWATAKMGILGLAFLLLVYMVSVARPVGHHIATVCARAVLVSFLGISFAVPMPNGQASGPLVGGVLALALRSVEATRPAESRPRRPVSRPVAAQAAAAPGP